MEGIAGVTKWDETTGGEPLHAERSRLYTEEINAAVRGAFTGGATEVVVMDCHGAGKGWTFNSLIPDQLDPRCDFVVQQEWTEYTEFLEQGCDAALFVGMHAMAGTPDGVLNHTVSGTGWRSLAFNGTLVGETGINAALCGTWGCPVLMVTGDAATCREATALLGDGLTTVAVKQGLGRFSARHIAPVRARELIEKAAASALVGPHRRAPVRPRQSRARSGSSSRPATRSSATATTPWSRSPTAARSSRAPTTGGRPGGSSTSRSSATSDRSAYIGSGTQYACLTPIYASRRCAAWGDASQNSSIFVASSWPRRGETAHSSTGSSPSFLCERGVSGATRATLPAASSTSRRRIAS